MNTTNDRKKEIVRAYKERKPPQGIFAIRCTTTGEIWVASSRHLDTQKNRLWFGLRLGNYTNVAMQKAWNEHGEGSFQYDIVEEIDVDDLTPYLLDRLLKEREQHWLLASSAKPVIG